MRQLIANPGVFLTRGRQFPHLPGLDSAIEQGPGDGTELLPIANGGCLRVTSPCRRTYLKTSFALPKQVALGVSAQWHPDLMPGIVLKQAPGDTVRWYPMSSTLWAMNIWARSTQTLSELRPAWQEQSLRLSQAESS
jgi:hypothetical protein